MTVPSPPTLSYSDEPPGLRLIIRRIDDDLVIILPPQSTFSIMRATWRTTGMTSLLLDTSPPTESARQVIAVTALAREGLPARNFPHRRSHRLAILPPLTAVDKEVDAPRCAELSVLGPYPRKEPPCSYLHVSVMSRS